MQFTFPGTFDPHVNIRKGAEEESQNDVDMRLLFVYVIAWFANNFPRNHFLSLTSQMCLSGREWKILLPRPTFGNATPSKIAIEASDPSTDRNNECWHNKSALRS